MPISYLYTALEFLNATRLDLGDIQDKVLLVGITSASLLYLNGGDGVEFVFSNELSVGDKATLDTFVANYTDPIIYTETTCKISDIKSPGTNGGSFTQGVWTKRELNVLEGLVDFASLDVETSTITLKPGKYIVTARAPSCGAGNNQVRIRNMTTGDYTLGMNTYSTSNFMSTSDISQYFEFTGNTDIVIEHICSITTADIGFGRAVGYGANEIYTTVFIQKIGDVNV